MILPAKPLNEKERLASLEDSQILYTPFEAEFDNITKLASFICNTPISLISLVGKDKQWYKSKHGAGIGETNRDISFCSHAILQPDTLMEIKDTRLDERFKDNPFTIDSIDPVIYYAGMPLLDHNGYALGTLCVLDSKTHCLNQDQKDALKTLAKQVEMLLELRRKNVHLEKLKKELNQQNSLLKDFAGVVSHDMKMPLANMIITADILKAKYGEKIGEEGKKYLHHLKQAGLKLSEYISGLLIHYESDTISGMVKQEFDLHQMLEEIIDLLNITDDVEIKFPEKNYILISNRSALEQIFLNLLSNSLKYNNKEKIIIEVTFCEDEDFYHFSITDNGIGIPQDQKEEIFKIFTTLAVSDRKGNKGNGIGLSTVKKLITNLGGNIYFESEPNNGTTFHFSIKRNI